MKKIIFYLLALIFILSLILGFLWWNNKPEKAASGDQSLNSVKKSGKLIIGSNYSYGVMEFFDQNGQPAGIDIDLGQEIASRLGVKAEFKGFDWQDLFSVASDKEVDLIISSLTITEERSKKLLFSAPYFNGGQVILVRTNNTAINSTEDLKSKKIGVQLDTTSKIEAEKLTDSNLITSYSSWENSDKKGGIIYDLKDGKIDAIIVDYIQGLESVKNNPEIKMVGDPFTQEYYGIATNLESKALMAAVNETLKDIKREEALKKIQDKWTK